MPGFCHDDMLPRLDIGLFLKRSAVVLTKADVLLIKRECQNSIEFCFHFLSLCELHTLHAHAHIYIYIHIKSGT